MFDERKMYIEDGTNSFPASTIMTDLYLYIILEHAIKFFKRERSNMITQATEYLIDLQKELFVQCDSSLYMCYNGIIIMKLIIGT